ncbi:spermidine synthase [Nesterenkonia sphaerica]|uniref:Spermidine synthase n=1 Tax=Nesterenkonia sphaerica TaxID=1804988 RepID=A0A5R9A762_9MICC|nr:fused MFS/spermidine synthase [Nesterenkonia sphaerica]TLP74350.1 spermidine synthase [Nesterenkonia sphaerica]
MTLPARRRLSHSGQWAELSRDELTDHGVMLSIGGVEQSHVELGDPDFLLHDYLRRMRSVLTTWSAEQHGRVSGSVLHLGAGALTLPRWISHWRPGTEQTVVDIEPELVTFVLEHLPMTPAPENIVGDAATVLTAEGALSGRSFATVVVDLFNSAAAPAALTSPEFFRFVWAAVAPGGLMLVNMGDDAGMTFAKGLTQTIVDALALGPGCCLLSAPADVVEGEAEGNLVFAASHHTFSEAELGQIWAAGPHPAEVLSGDELQLWWGNTEPH